MQLAVLLTRGGRAAVFLNRGDRSAGLLCAGMLVCGLLAACAWAASSTRAQEGPDALVAARSADPLTLAPIVARLGDSAVLARLAEGQPTEVQLAAIHASRTLLAPEAALGLLATHAAGRDPDLAPAAARAALDISRALDARDLDAREVAPAALDEARATLASLGADETARPDLRRAALLSVDALAGLWPAPPASTEAPPEE